MFTIYQTEENPRIPAISFKSSSFRLPHKLNNFEIVQQIIHEMQTKWIVRPDSSDVDSEVRIMIESWNDVSRLKENNSDEDRRQKALEGAIRIVNAREEERQNTGVVFADQYFTLGVGPLVDVLYEGILDGITVLEFGGGTGIITNIIESYNPRHIRVWEIDTAAVAVLSHVVQPEITTIEQSDFTRIGNWPEIIRSLGGPSSVAIIANPPYFSISLIKAIADANNIQDVILYLPRRLLVEFPASEGWSIIGCLSEKDFYPTAPSTATSANEVEGGQSGCSQDETSNTNQLHAHPTSVNPLSMASANGTKGWDLRVPGVGSPSSAVEVEVDSLSASPSPTSPSPAANGKEPPRMNWPSTETDSWNHVVVARGRFATSRVNGVARASAGAVEAAY